MMLNTVPFLFVWVHVSKESETEVVLLGACVAEIGAKLLGKCYKLLIIH